MGCWIFFILNKEKGFQKCEICTKKMQVTDMQPVTIKMSSALRNVAFPTQAVEEEDKMTPEQLAIKNVGKQVMFCVNVFIIIGGKKPFL